MTSRRRITLALIGLIALVVIGWFVREYTAHGEALHQAPVVEIERGCDAQLFGFGTQRISLARQHL